MIVDKQLYLCSIEMNWNSNNNNKNNAANCIYNVRWSDFSLKWLLVSAFFLFSLFIDIICDKIVWHLVYQRLTLNSKNTLTFMLFMRSYNINVSWTECSSQRVEYLYLYRWIVQNSIAMEERRKKKQQWNWKKNEINCM